MFFRNKEYNNVSIYKFLARLCRFIPNPHWQLMTEQYMKISGKFPESPEKCGVL